MNILDEANLKIRNQYPFTGDINNFCTVYETSSMLQINFESKGCKNSYNGKCIMCDYGRGRNISKDEMLHALNYAINEVKGNPQVLLLNTYGSILDEFEFSEENFIILLQEINKLNFHTILFETHYKTITEEKIKLIKKHIPNKDIIFEIGVETFNAKYRKYCLNKDIDNNELFNTIKLIKEKCCSVSVNLLVGIPFLDMHSQLNDVIEAINIAFENGIDEITLFPINVKPYTLLYELYKQKLYTPVSKWMLVEILNRIKPECINKITFAWFGNREMSYSKNITIFPTACSKCEDNLNTFFEKFNNLEYPNKIELLRNINSISNNCDCYNNFNKSLNIRNNKKFEENIKEVYDVIKNM